MQPSMIDANPDEVYEPGNCPETHYRKLRTPMANRKPQIPSKYQAWIDVRKKHCLSHAHIQMARELGMNPKSFGKISNHSQEAWKAPLPVFIEDLYQKHFRKGQPEEVKSIEQVLKEREKKKRARRMRKQMKADGKGFRGSHNSRLTSGISG